MVHALLTVLAVTFKLIVAVEVTVSQVSTSNQYKVGSNAGLIDLCFPLSYDNTYGLAVCDSIDSLSPVNCFYYDLLYFRYPLTSVAVFLVPAVLGMLKLFLGNKLSQVTLVFWFTVIFLL